MKNNLTLLGGLSVKEFLRDYWQQKTLLTRRAIPVFTGQLDATDDLPTAAMDMLYQWYEEGYLVPITNTRKTST